MKLIYVVLLLSLLSFSIAHQYDCENNFYDDDYCLISSLRVSSEYPACKMQFPEQKSIQLQFAHLEYLSPVLLYRMPTVERLDISNSYVRKAFVKPALEYLKISGSQLTEVFLDLDEEYQLTNLHLPANQLTRLPNNLNHLKNLTMLDLTNNRLDFLDMSQFNGLTNLLWVQLNDNYLKVVFSAEPVILPVLSDLSMARNDIALLDMSRWEIPLLQEFYISNNRLQELSNNFPKKFPLLRTVSLAENQWDCEWQVRVRQELQQQNSTFEWFACQDSEQTQATVKGLKHEQQLRQSMKDTIVQFAKNATGTEMDFDDIVDDLFCRMYGEQ
uniref:Putative membrane glycoprotein lig-1 n=1 Tax=Culex tarsalis TaxID=7177 RepID=A0A1Q3FQT0_CULTA